MTPGRSRWGFPMEAMMRPFKITLSAAVIILSLTPAAFAGGLSQAASNAHSAAVAGPGGSASSGSKTVAAAGVNPGGLYSGVGGEGYAKTSGDAGATFGGFAEAHSHAN